MLLAKAIDIFIIFKRAKNLSPRTIEWYEHQLNIFARSLPPTQQLAEVDALDIANYIAEQADPARGLSPSTIQARYRTVHAFFNWAERSKTVGAPPSPIGHGRDKIIDKPQASPPTTRYVPYADLNRYLDAIVVENWQDARDRLLAIVLFWTGVRLQECADLRVNDIDTQRQLVLVREGKGRKTRLIPFDNDSLRPALLEYLYLRPGWNGKELWLGQSADSQRIIKPLQSEGIRQVLIRRCQRAHIPYYNPHSWRHAFGMWLINCGASMAAISLVMGHSSVQVTEKVYAHMQTPAVQREYAAAVAHMKSNGGLSPLW